MPRPARQRALRGHQHAARPVTGRAANSPDHHARLATRLTARDRWIVRMLHEHRVLTTPQVTACAFPSQRAAEQRLLELFRWSVVSRFRPPAVIGSAPMYYVLGPAGAVVLAAEHGLDVKDLGYRQDRELGRAYSMTLAHTVGINDWFAALLAHARHHPDRTPPTTTLATTTPRATTLLDTTLLAWWSEHRCARHFGDLVRPDGYGRWRAQGREVEFFLEFDFGTEALAVVAGKLAGYARLAASTGITTPLLVWLPTSRREAAARRLLARAWRGLDEPATVPVATAAADLLDPDDPIGSPADPVWLPLGPTHPDVHTDRCALHRLLDAWPDLQPPAPPTPPDAAGQLIVQDGRALLPPSPPMPPPPHQLPQTSGRGVRTRWGSSSPSPGSPPSS
jgi:hypothetical protein